MGNQNQINGPVAVYDTLANLFEQFGDEQYGEAVTQRDHMLQSACLAEQNGETDAIIVACLLHDVGHFVGPQQETLKTSGKPEQDFKHEVLGARYLATYFDVDITIPIQLHVAAKRYLSAVEKGYFDSLSKASQYSLVLQGGPMNDKQIAKFKAGEFYKSALSVRYYDDHGKNIGSNFPNLEHYRELILKQVKPT